MNMLAAPKLGMDEGSVGVRPRFSITDPEGLIELTNAQKAAVVVQLIISSGETIPLSMMSEATQVHLARVYANMGPLNKITVETVINEFSEQIEALGLSFPLDTGAALEALSGQLDEDLLRRMRHAYNPTVPQGVWERISGLAPEALAERLSQESARIAAVILSKLPTEISSQVLDSFEADQANAVGFAFSETGLVQQSTVDIIAQSIVDDVDALSGDAAFKTTPATRAADLLNAVTTAQREAVMEALEKEDAKFAADVRKAIFTFEDIKVRLKPDDVSKIVREVAADELAPGLKAGMEMFPDSANFILESLSKRMADQMRDDISDAPALSPKKGEAAMGQITAAIRRLVELGDIVLKDRDEDQE